MRRCIAASLRAATASRSPTPRARERAGLFHSRRQRGDAPNRLTLRRSLAHHDLSAHARGWKHLFIEFARKLPYTLVTYRCSATLSLRRELFMPPRAHDRSQELLDEAHPFTKHAAARLHYGPRYGSAV
jgi:hypothetical protein